MTELTRVFSILGGENRRRRRSVGFDIRRKPLRRQTGKAWHLALSLTSWIRTRSNGWLTDLVGRGRIVKCFPG